MSHPIIQLEGIHKTYQTGEVAVEALRGALTLPVADALKRERQLFLQLLAGDQSKAQRHIFFAEREAAKVPDIAGAKARDGEALGAVEKRRLRRPRLPQNPGAIKRQPGCDKLCCNDE